jgi:hypothetical protein
VLVTAVLFGACSGTGQPPGGVPGDGGVGELGTVVSAVNVTCDATAPAGATCMTLMVRCPSIEDLQATVALSEPAGTATGTLFMHAGGGGTAFYTGAYSRYLAAGLRTVQVKWASAWEQSTNASMGILAAACRPATVMKWAFDTPHGGARTKAFCAVGHSGGSGVISYSLAHYGMGEYLDYASLSAGPPFGRIDYGCAPQTYSGTAKTLCPELADAPTALPPSVMNPWEHTTTCGAVSPPASDIVRWAADSVVSPAASYDYPNTVVTFWDCAVNPNGTTGGAYFYSKEIVSTKQVTCFTACSGESLGTAGQAAQADDLLARCIPRH